LQWGVLGGVVAGLPFGDVADPNSLVRRALAAAFEQDLGKKSLNFVLSSQPNPRSFTRALFANDPPASNHERLRIRSTFS